MKRGHLPPVDPELKHAINANLAYIRSGQAARDKAAAAGVRREQRRRLKELNRLVKQLNKKEDSLRDELLQTDRFFEQCEVSDNPLGYAEGMTAAQKQGLIEEIDSAREGCLTELLKVETDRDIALRDIAWLERKLS